MLGQGSPQRELSRSTRQLSLIQGWSLRSWWCLVWFCALLTYVPSLNAQQQQLDMRLRVAWGGGRAKSWSGSLEVAGGRLTDLRDLGLSADSPGSKEIINGRVRIGSTTAADFNGFDISVSAPEDALLNLQIKNTKPDALPVQIQVPLNDLITQVQSVNLDDSGNKLIVWRAPGDELRVALSREHLVFMPGEPFPLHIEPHLIDVESNSSLRLKLQLFESKSSTELWNTQQTVDVDEDGTLAAVELPDFAVPADEGVYELAISLQRRSRLDVTGWRTTVLKERSIQFVVIEPQPAELDNEPDWREEGTLDPTDASWRNWATKIPGMSLLPGMDQSKPLSNSTPKQIEYANTPMLELAAGQWQAFPLTITSPGQPHLLDVEIPHDFPQTLGISVIEPNEAGEVGSLGLDSGVFVPESISADGPAVAHHRLVFWPRTKAPLVLLVNHRRDGAAVFGRIRVYNGPSRLPSAPITSTPSERLLAAFFDKPIFPENFLASGAINPGRNQVLDDWSKFYRGTCRLAEYLKYAGYNGAVVCVAREGSALYPSNLLSPTPKYDNGVFFTSGRDPIRKDVLEMMFRIFDREGLQLIPAIHFSGRIPRLERLGRGDTPQVDGIVLQHVDGSPSPTHYNPLHPNVQETMQAVARELTGRYAGHASFHGIAVQLAADSYGILPDERWGVDRPTLDRFRRSGFDGTEPEQVRLFKDASTMLRNPLTKQKWLEWRAHEMARLYATIFQTVREARPEGKLLLLTADMFQGRTQQDVLRPILPPPTTHPISQASLLTGILAREYRRDPGMVLFRPQRHSASFSVNDQAVNLQLNAAEVDAYFRVADSARGNVSSGAQFFCERIVLPLPSFDEVSPFGKENTHVVLQTHAAPVGIHNRKRWAHALAMIDAHDIVDGGSMLALGQEDSVAPLIETYRLLPRLSFEQIRPHSQSKTQPLVVRVAQASGRLYFFVVNDSPWPVRASLEITGRRDMRLQALGTRTWPALTETMQNWTWQIDLEPYDVVGAWLNDPRAAIVDWQVRVPPQVLSGLDDHISKVREKAGTVAAAPALTLPLNAGFEIRPGPNDRPIPNWEFQSGLGKSVVLDKEDKRSGDHSLHMKNSGTDELDGLWIRSDAFATPSTGRLYVWVRLKTRRRSSQPLLRVVLDDDGDFYQARIVGRGSSTELPDRWDEGFLFSFEQLPVSRLQNLRLGFDLMGAGDVWIDDIQLYDVWLQKQEHDALVYGTVVAQTDIARYANITNAREFLDGFWPRFLATYVPPQKEAPRVAAARDEAPAADDKAKRSKIDQMRDFVPKVPFKVPPFKR